MPLTVGTGLGPYEILGALGAAGRGEVYRARDGRMGRDVALKIPRCQPWLRDAADRVVNK
jgi:serine/threonine protein kinase